MSRTRLPVLFIVFAVSCIYLATIAVRSQPDSTRDAMMLRRHVDSSRTIHLRTDFASFYYAARAVATHTSLYTAKSLDSLAATDRVANHVLPYLYPPFLAVLAQPLTWLTPEAAQSAWDFLQILLFGLAAAMMVMVGSHGEGMTKEHTSQLMLGVIVVAAVFIFPFEENIAFGQANSVVLILIMLCLLYSSNNRYHWLAGAALSAATLVKVTPAMLLLFFLVGKKWNIIGGFVAGLLLLILLSLVAAGDPWAEFVGFLPDMGYARNVQGGFHPSIVANFSLAGFFMRLLPGEGTAIRLLTITAIAILLAIVLYYHLRDSQGNVGDAYILPYLIIMVIASPVAWRHHLVLITPGVVVVLLQLWLARGTRKGRVGFGIACLLAALATINFQTIYPSVIVSEQWRPVVTSMNLWLLLLLLLSALLFVRRTGQPTTTDTH